MHRAHLHGDARARELALEHRRVVRLREDRLFDGTADLAAIDVERGDDLEVLNPISADLGVHHTRGLRRVVMLVVLDALKQRACTIADARDRELDGLHDAASPLFEETLFTNRLTCPRTRAP